MLLICVPFAKVLHKIPYVVIHSGLDVLGCLPLNDSQDVREIHFWKCGSPPSLCIFSPPLSFACESSLQKFVKKPHSMCKGQSAVSGVPLEEI